MNMTSFINEQRRSHPLHPIVTPEYSQLLRGHRVGWSHFAEEGFHFPSREKRDENPATCLTDKGPDMGNLARCQQRITRLEAKTLCPHLELELAFSISTSGEKQSRGPLSGSGFAHY